MVRPRVQPSRDRGAVDARGYVVVRHAPIRHERVRRDVSRRSSDVAVRRETSVVMMMMIIMEIFDGRRSVASVRARREHRVREALGGGHRAVAGHARGRDERAHRLQARALRLHQRLERSQRRFRLRERLFHRIQLGAHRRRARAVVGARAGRARLRLVARRGRDEREHRHERGEDGAHGGGGHRATPSGESSAPRRARFASLGRAVGQILTPPRCAAAQRPRAPPASRVGPAPTRVRALRAQRRDSRASRRSVTTPPSGTRASERVPRRVEAARRGKRRRTSAGRAPRRPPWGSSRT
jgi:hypothetical protein